MKRRTFIASTAAVISTVGLVGGLKPAQELRKVERYRDGKWVECKFKDLITGDIFRMFEPDGTEVDGGEQSIACSDAEYDDHQILYVRAESL